MVLEGVRGGGLGRAVAPLEPEGLVAEGGALEPRGLWGQGLGLQLEGVTKGPRSEAVQGLNPDPEPNIFFLEDLMLIFYTGF